jgi:hypothetical protein
MQSPHIKQAMIHVKHTAVLLLHSRTQCARNPEKDSDSEAMLMTAHVSNPKLLSRCRVSLTPSRAGILLHFHVGLV